MKRETIIKRYVGKNILPRKDLCPIIVQRWKTSNGYIYWDSKTNTRFDSLSYGRPYSSIDIFSYGEISPRKLYTSFYMRYDEKNEMLEISLINCNGNRGKDGVEKIWEYDNENRYFLFKNDFHPYKYDEENNNVILAFSDDNGKYYNKKFIREFLKLNYNLSQISTREWKKYAENTYCSSGFIYKFHMIDAYKNMVERNIKENPLTQMEFKPFDFFYENLKKSGEYTYSNIVIFEKIDENSGVFRYFLDRFEKIRLFIVKNKPTVLLFHNAKWEVSNYLPSEFMGRYHNLVSTKNIFNFEESLNIKSINYISEIIYDIDDKKCYNILDIIVTILRHPIIERLYKSGYKDLAKSILADYSPIGIVKKIFNLKKEVKTIKEIKLNKHILSKLNQFCSEMNLDYVRRIPYNAQCLIRNLDGILGRETFNHLSKKDIILWMDFIINYDYVPCFYEQTNNEITINPRYIRYDFDNLSENDKKLLNKIRRIIENNISIRERYITTNSIARLYKNIFSLYYIIHNKPDIDFVNAINSYNDLINIHENLVALLNEEDRMARERYSEITSKAIKEKFEKLQDERKELYNYEDDKYIIRVPENLTEITEEGIALGHCVGSYVNRHASGNTNIIFIRKKDKKNESFYTIEVSNGKVIQIHGKHNRWLGNDPDAIPSVYKWINERKLQCSYNILLNLGTGYTPSDKMLDRSVLNKSVITY